MPVTPETNYSAFKNNELTKNSALELVVTLIENSEKLTTKLESIDILGKINIKDKGVKVNI